jgi:hypothetical protein
MNLYISVEQGGYEVRGGHHAFCGSKLRLKFPFDNMRYGAE